MAKTIRAKCLDALQLLVRLEAANDEGYVRCVTCGIWRPWNDGMQGGHFIAKGDSSYWALEKENVHPQCSGCNSFGMKFGTAQIRYTLFMEDMYSKDKVEEMLACKKTTKKICKADYRNMLSQFNEDIRFHKKRIGA